MTLQDRLGELERDTVVHLGTPAHGGFVRIEAAEALARWVALQSWGEREVLEAYPMILDPGIGMIVEGTEHGKFWFLDEAEAGIIESDGIVRKG